ncbi:MAG: ribonuclease E/G [Alphaproteobacteria bacterium]|nr:ribonuclease E/G [Alphaproteobacteria bacterium]
MTTRLLVVDQPGERWIAREVDGTITDLLVERGAPDPTGAVVRARVTRVDADLGASFVSLGPLGDGFLNGISHPEGSAVVVQVVRGRARGKAVAVSARPERPGRLLVAQPASPGLQASRKLSEAERKRLRALLAPHVQEGEGWMLRSAAAGAGEADLVADLTRLRAATAAWSAIGPAPMVLSPPPDALDRVSEGGEAVVVNHPPLRPQLAARGYSVTLDAGVEHQVEGAIEAALQPVIPLPGGALMRLEPTAALVAVDVDRAGASDSADAINARVIPCLFAALRLRRLGGLVLVDLLRQSDPPSWLTTAQSLARAAGGQCHGLTRTGLLELTLPQPGTSLAEDLSGLEAVLSAAVRAWARRVAVPPHRATLVVAQVLVPLLTQRLPAVAARYGIAPTWSSLPPTPANGALWQVVEE